jgi:8-oxo-dGTP diphosphatase
MWSKDGPGLCFHHFVKSDPDRGYHDHPWGKAVSFILCGGYEERILDSDKISYKTHYRSRWTFNYLDGAKTFHRVILPEGKDAWTIFAFQRRSKTWSMISLKGEEKPMSTTVTDLDGGWWKSANKGIGVHSHLELKGKVIATVDTIVIAEDKILLIKRGKEPYKDCWAFPGGRIEQTDVDILAAAKRELKEETNLCDVELTYVKTIGNSYRDPRGFCLTNIFLCKLDKIPDKVRAGDDAVDFEWFELHNLPTMAFDHKDILDNIIN